MTTLNTPAGTPARSASSASASAVSGVCEAGLTTIVQPAASAGAALRVIIAAGKFHGVIAAQTPTGSLSTTMRRDGVGRREDVAADALGLLGEPLDERRRVRHLAARFRERLALLERDQAGEILGVLDDQVEPAAQHAGPAPWPTAPASRAGAVRPRRSASAAWARLSDGRSATVAPVEGLSTAKRPASPSADPGAVDVRRRRAAAAGRRRPAADTVRCAHFRHRLDADGQCRADAGLGARRTHIAATARSWTADPTDL